MDDLLTAQEGVKSIINDCHSSSQHPIPNSLTQFKFESIIVISNATHKHENG